jgi:itaconate CoA-transferase
VTGTAPLAGVLVVALEQAVAGPLASRHLADQGARVIKVERPGTGDFARGYDRQANGLSSHFVWLNRGKESVELDLKSAADRALAWRMIARADVVVQNLAPGSLARLGLDADAVRGRFPRIVYASISGYGETGPYAHRKAYDLLIQSDAGLLSITGSPDAPAKAGIPVADIAAGMYAFAGVLAGLLRRQATGLGATVRVSMLEALAEWMGYPLAYALGGGAGPARSGASHATIAPYGPFPTSTGAALFVAVQNDREWRSFCQAVLADPGLATDSRFRTNTLRVANRPALEQRVTEAFARLTPQQAADLLERAGIAYAQMRAVGEVARHPQLAARRRWARAATENGAIPQLIPPITWDGEAVTELAAVPSLGQHNQALRAEFGGGPQSAPR